MTKIASSEDPAEAAAASPGTPAPCPGSCVVTVAGSVSRASCLDARDRVAERDARLQVERERHRRQLADVVDRQRADASVAP